MVLSGGNALGGLADGSFRSMQNEANLCQSLFEFRYLLELLSERYPYRNLTDKQIRVLRFHRLIFLIWPYG